MYSTPTTAHIQKPSIRETVAMIIVNAMKPVYFALRSHRKTWRTTQTDLAAMPEGTLGRDLSVFLQNNGLTLMPKAEFHDVYHVLFGFGTTMREETCIQFLPMGNGRYSIPHIITNAVSLVFYPEHWGDYYKAYHMGRRANTFHDWDFEPMLCLKTTVVRKLIFGE